MQTFETSLPHALFRIDILYIIPFDQEDLVTRMIMFNLTFQPSSNHVK